MLGTAATAARYVAPPQDIIGNYAGYVGAAVVIFILVWAFLRGQPIEFGPVKIGGRRRTQPDKARAYNVGDAARFYAAIAVNYDQGNSPNLLATHMEVIALISQVTETKPAARILDLGGGTGHAVATHFFDNTDIQWTYVDFSPGMAGQLQQHLAGRPLYDNLQVHVEDIHNVHQRLAGRHFDVVLLNVVCSSMPRLPDFARIAELMTPDGLLIVSDINPQYTDAHPFYKGTTAEGTTVCLRTQPVQPLDVLARSSEAGLQLAEMRKIVSTDIDYSFIAVFANGVRPGGSRPARGGLLNGSMNATHG